MLALVLVSAAPFAARADGAADLAVAETAVAASDFDAVLRLADQAIGGGDLIAGSLAQAHFVRAGALRGAGQPDLAVDAYVAALQIQPRRVEAFIGLGRALDDQGRHAEAEQAHLRAVFLRPDLPDTYIARGDSYVLAGECGRAIADYTRAVAIDPDNEPALAGLEQAQRGAQ